MDEATTAWEEGATARLRDEPKPPGVNPFHIADDADNDLKRRDGWLDADDFLARPGDDSRFVALWLEHLASELQEEAVARNAIADHTGADRLMDEAEAHLVSAKAIRVRLLGEESTDG